MDVQHYQLGNMECIEIIQEALSPEEYQGYLKGNIIKYLYRGGFKDSKEKDLYKAADYAARLATGKWLSEQKDV